MTNKFNVGDLIRYKGTTNRTMFLVLDIKPIDNIKKMLLYNVFSMTVRTDYSADFGAYIQYYNID